MDSENSGPPSASGVKVFTRKYLFELMQRQNLKTFVEKLEFLENYLLVRYGDTDDKVKWLKQKVSHVKSEMKQRWLKESKTESKFLSKNEDWLKGTFEILIGTPSHSGRPSRTFSDSSERSKRRKTEELRESVEPEAIVHAAQMILQADGKRSASRILKDISNSPTKAMEYIKRHSGGDKAIPPRTPFDALKMIVKADLTRRQYEIIRTTNKKHFPCYDLVLKSKQECYPPKTALRVTATCAEIDIQSLIDHTITRLSTFLEDVLLKLNEIEKKSLTIICKWGCDGSQQAQFKQKLSNEGDSDANIFISSFVPLQIVCGVENKKVIWQNPTPSSPRFCRPIRFRFVKESTDITKDEIKYVQSAVRSLTTTKVNLKGSEYEYSHVMKMTMVDGKVCNAATNTSSTSRCYICGSTSKDFNNLDKMNDVCPEALEFGISVLHARIRLFESILHLAYKLPVKKYRERRTTEETLLENQRMKEIQERFRNETGLLVDMPKTHVGNTNDGNTSRRFFENTELAAEITGIDHEFIFRIKVILETISSGHKTDVLKYNTYALDTAKLYIHLYGWHPMTPTMHKILIHGASIIENAMLPIGQLSEEAAEARNKHFRLYRQNFARKFSREECNLDIYLRLLLTSDPLISSMRTIKKAPRKSFLKETIHLLLPAEPNVETEQYPDDEAEESSFFE